MSTQELTFKSIVNGVSLPSLEDISIATLAIDLMENKEIKKIYYKHFSVETTLESNLSDFSVRKLTFLCKSLIKLPDVLQTKLVKCFHWIREQYFNWICFIMKELPHLQMIFPNKMDFIFVIMNSVKWRSGNIDKKKSIYQIISLRHVMDDASLNEVFRMASRFFLEDDLRILWEKISDAEISKLVDNCNSENLNTLYWICKMKGDMREFMESIPDHNEDSDICPLVLHIFEGDILGVKYFYKLKHFDMKLKLHIVRKLLKELHYDGSFKYYQSGELDQYAAKILLLLKKIKDESVLKEIFDEFFKVFFRVSVLHWPWRKLFLTLLKIYGNNIDKILFYDLMAQLLKDVKIQKADIFEVKMLWKNVSSEVKISFSSYISNEQNDRDVGSVWENMTIEMLGMFLKDEQLRNILTPYENYGILRCLIAGRYDFIEFWLQKCLVSEEAIVSYFQNFIQTQFFEDLKALRICHLSRLNKFLDWALKYEDFMSSNDILKAKDQVINDNLLLQVSVNVLWDKKNLEDLKKLMDWMMKNQDHEYEDKVISWKQKVIEKFFLRMCDSSCNDFKNSLSDFLSYGVNDPEKIKIMMKRANLNEKKFFLKYLRSDFALIDSYLSFLEGYGKHIYLIKRNIFYYIFNECEELYFVEEKFCENIKKLLYWNRESNVDMKREVESITKTIIMEGAVRRIFRCVHIFTSSVRQNSGWLVTGINNILRFLFEGKIKEEEWSKMLFGLKIEVIKQLVKCSKCCTWKVGKFYEIMIILINYGKENEYIREDNWQIKKYLIECLIHKLQKKRIPKTVLHKSFVYFVLKGNEVRPDYQEIIKKFDSF